MNLCRLGQCSFFWAGLDVGVGGLRCLPGWMRSGGAALV